jgi:hypothetical protein
LSLLIVVLLHKGTIWLDMVATWWAIRPWQRHFWSNNWPILTRKILYYGVGGTLNVGVTRIWKNFTWAFWYGHHRCLRPYMLLRKLYVFWRIQCSSSTVMTIPKTKFGKEGSGILFLVFARGQKQKQFHYLVRKGLRPMPHENTKPTPPISPLQTKRMNHISYG